MGGNSTADAGADLSNLDLLAVRLRRLEFLLAGSSDVDGVPNGVIQPATHDTSVLGRLQALQSGLDRLRKDGGIGGEMIRDIEGLCECDNRATEQLLIGGRQSTP